MERNHEKAVWAMRLLRDGFDAPAPCPVDMLGSMASVPMLPHMESTPFTGKVVDPVQERLYHEFGIEVPVVNWPASGRRLVRVSAQAYNRREDYEYLVSSLRRILS